MCLRTSSSVNRPLSLIALHDRALAHAVAAADLGVVGHRGGAVLALVAGVAEVRFAEHQLVADVGDAAALAQQLEVPRAVDGVAVQHARRRACRP